MDFIFLTKLTRQQLGQQNLLTKFIEAQGTEEIPKNSKIYVSIKVYNFKGEFKEMFQKMLFRQHDHCQGIRIAIRSMKKYEKSWFRIKQKYLGMSKYKQEKGLYFQIYLEDFKYKLENHCTIQERILIYKQKKAQAETAFKSQNYNLAAKLYLTCMHYYSGIPKKQQVAEQQKKMITEEMKKSKRNFIISILKGEIKQQYEKAREFSAALVKDNGEDAKNLYLHGKVLYQLKYFTDAEQFLRKSYNISKNPETLALMHNIQNIKSKKTEKHIYKHVIENMQNERINQSRQKKKNQKKEWLEKAEEDEDKQLVLQKLIKVGQLDVTDFNVL